MRSVNMDVCVLGDSHASVFHLCNSNEIQFHVKMVPGATAQGCVNPNNETHSLRLFEEHVLEKRRDKVMVMLGEVDCGYLAWVRSKKYNISVDSQIDHCIANIATFMATLVEKGYAPEQLILCGAHLPTIKDNTDPRYLNGARKEVAASQHERTLLTLDYNKRLRKIATTNGYNYVDITRHIMGENGVVQDLYLNHNPYDHHLENAKIVDFWKQELVKTFETRK